MSSFLFDKVKEIEKNYNPDHDINVDFNWVDMQLLTLCKHLICETEMLLLRIHELERANEI